MSTKNVKNTLISDLLSDLHESLIDIVSGINFFLRNEATIRETGMALDKALLPLLVIVNRRGPIGVVELAGRVGRDYTTVSRQITKLASLGLIERRENAADRRVREAVITAKGKRVTTRLDAARERMAHTVFATWEQQDIQSLARLMHKVADGMKEGPPGLARRP